LQRQVLGQMGTLLVGRDTLSKMRTLKPSLHTFSLRQRMKISMSSVMSAFSTSEI